MSDAQPELLHREINQRLLDWANQNYVQSDTMVLSLASDFQQEENLHIWASMDPFDFLPNPDSFSGNNLLKWAKNLANIRNVAVFVPVAITWEAVSKATAAFANFVESNNATTVNFLEFWQNGYNILPKFWTISQVARLDFLIVFAIIIFSLISTYTHARGSSLNRSHAQQIENERLEMALVLKMYLYSLREIDKNNVKEGITSSVSSLLSATSSLSKGAKQLSSIVNELGARVPVVNEFGIQMAKETDKMVKQVGHLTVALSQINNSITGELHEAVTAATFGLDLANDELTNSTESIRKNSAAAANEIRSLQRVIKKVTRNQ
jgi:hypothetical protein